MVKRTEKEGRKGGQWVKRIEAVKREKSFEAFRKAGETSYKVFRREESDGRPKPPFPIWWSTVTVMKGQLAAQVPKPDIRERFQPLSEGDPPNPVAEYATKILERAIDFLVDTEDFHGNADRAVTDWLVSGLGVARVELHSHIVDAPVGYEEDDEGPEPQEAPEEGPIIAPTVARQSIKLRFHPWARFYWDQAERWEDVEWVAFEHSMSARQIKDEYGEEPNDRSKDEDKSYPVYEVWCKRSRMVHIIAPCCGGEIDAYPDPLKLQGFFPLARPLTENVADDEWVPKSNYDFIAELDRNLQVRVQRIIALSREIKDTGFYDASLAELAGIKDARDGDLIPVQDLAARLNQTNGAALGFQAVIAKQDNTGPVQVIQTLAQLIESDKQQIYETIGVSDIVRGASEASETATAQQIKGQWANVRNGPRARQLAYWWRDTYRIIAEIVSEHVTDEQLASWTGLEIPPEVRAALKSDVGRTLLIDVETDATMAQDDAAMKQAVAEIGQTLTGYIQATQPLVAQGVLPADSVKELLMFLLSPFKRAKPALEAIQAMPGTQQQMQQMNQQLQQLQQQLQQAQQALSRYQQGEEQRANALAQADVQLKGAQAAKTLAEAQRAGLPDPQQPPEDKSAEDALKFAQAGKAQAETVKTQVETALMPQKMQQDAQAKRESLAVSAMRKNPQGAA